MPCLTPVCFSRISETANGKKEKRRVRSAEKKSEDVKSLSGSSKESSVEQEAAKFDMGLTGEIVLVECGS